MADHPTTATIIQFPRGPHYGAAIDDETMGRIEKDAASSATVQQRRSALAAMARDSSVWVRLAREEPEAFAAMLQAVQGFRDHAIALLEVAEAACARLEIVQPEMRHG